MKGETFTTTSFVDVCSYASISGISIQSGINMSDMTTRDLLALTVKRSTVIEMSFFYKPSWTDPGVPEPEDRIFHKSTRLYSDLDIFKSEFEALSNLDSTREFSFKVSQLYHDPDTVIYLEQLSSSNTLSSQLRFYTGDSYNSLDFHDDDNPNELSASGLIVHKKTKQKFYIPPAPVDRYVV